MFPGDGDAMMAYATAADAGSSLAAIRRRAFAGGLLASVALHAAAILSGQYWLQPRTGGETVAAIDIAEVPAAELPPAPPSASVSRSAGPPPRAAAPPTATATAPPAPPTRQEIRREVSRKGLLGVLARRGPAGSGLARLAPPGDAPPARGDGPGPRENRRGGGAAQAPGADDDPGVSRQIGSAPRAPTAFAARTFTTDAGLEGRIEGAGGERARSDAAILATIERYRSGIKYAYDRELRTNPALDGEITVSFVIRPDGSVSGAAIRRSTVRWPSLEQAVLARVRSMRFAPAESGPVYVQFPFRFLPQM